MYQIDCIGSLFYEVSCCFWAGWVIGVRWVYDAMKFGTILTDEMKQTVETTRLGCGVWRVVDGGRLGQYKYFDMDDTIEAAMKDAKQFF